jgi:hypothetical protein
VGTNSLAENNPYNSGKPSALTEFPLGAEIGLLVKDANVLESYQVTIDWDNPSISPTLINGTLSFAGDANIPIQLPDVVCKGVLKFWYEGFFSSPTVILNLAVGETANLTTTPVQSSNIITQAETVLKWVAIGFGVVAVAWIASKAAPSVMKTISTKRKQ